MEKEKYHMISLIVEYLKNNTNEFIHKTEIDSQTYKTNIWLPKGIVGSGGINWEFGINKYTLLNIK